MLASCRATLTPAGENVFLHTETTNLVDGCHRLGRVAVESGSTINAGREIRNEAGKLGATDVALTHHDWVTSFTVKVYGIAYRCEK